MKLNPLSYGLAALRHGLYAGQPDVLAQLPSRTVTLVVSLAFAVAMCLVALALARRTTRGDLQ